MLSGADMEVPKGVRYVRPLRRTARGKLDRRRLAEAELPPADRRVVTAPRITIESVVAHVSVELLKCDHAGLDGHYFLLGEISMMAADLQARIETAFGVCVDAMHRGTTAAGIAAGIRRARSPARE